MPTDPHQAMIRPARPDEFPRLRDIETASDQLFLEVGIGPFVTSEDQDHFASAAAVLVYGDPPEGFACMDIVDGIPHIWQLSVDPTFGRQGRGGALIEAVCDWASDHGHEAVTLTTFRDVPWNGPFYSRRGFFVLNELPPELTAIRDREKAIGDDDFGPRVAMRRDLGSTR